MPWLKSDDKMPDNDKVWELSDAEYRLMDAGRHYAAKKLTDGWVPASRIPAMTPRPSTRRQVDALVKARLWHRIPDLCESCVSQRSAHRAAPLPKSGYIVHDYLRYNPSRVEWMEEQDERRRISSLGGRARASSAERDGGRFTSGRTSHRAPASAPSPYPVPRRPVDLRTTRDGLRPVGEVIARVVRDIGGGTPSVVTVTSAGAGR